MGPYVSKCAARGSRPILVDLMAIESNAGPQAPPPSLPAEQAQSIYGQSLPALMASPAIGAMVATVLWQTVSHTGLVFFVAMLVALSVARRIMVAAYRRTEPQITDHVVWLKRYAVGVALVGAVWGAGAVTFYVPGDPGLQVFLVFAIGGMAAGALNTHAHYLPAYLAFLLPAVVPLVVRLVFDFDRVHAAMGGMLALFVVMMVVIARNLNRSLVQQAGLRHDLILARDAAEAGVKAKADFLSVVTHELRTPITSVRGALGLLHGGTVGALTEEGRRLIEIGLRNSERLGYLIDDILDAEGLESGQLEMRVSVQPLGPLVQQAIDANRHFADQFHVGIDLCGNEGQIQVNVDERRFVQVMTNLLSNGAKFSPKGGRVDVQVAPRGDSVRVSVTDQGSGVPKEFQDRLFEKFAQADTSDSRLTGGTGLGLSISRSIIERLDGTIGFESGAGQGTTFYVDLPIVAAP